jgi:hypothetical protein
MGQAEANVSLLSCLKHLFDEVLNLLAGPCAHELFFYHLPLHPYVIVCFML